MVAGLQCTPVGFGHVPVAAKFFLDPVKNMIQRAVIQPAHQPQRKEVFATHLCRALQVQPFECRQR